MNEADQRRYEDARRRAVVSIYGRDLSSEDEIREAEPERREEDQKQTRTRRAA